MTYEDIQVQIVVMNLTFQLVVRINVLCKHIFMSFSNHTCTLLRYVIFQYHFHQA